MKKLRVACIQNNAGSNWQKNWDTALKIMDRSARRGAKLIALPEFFYWRGTSEQMPEAVTGSAVVLREAAQFAKENRCVVLLGSLLEKTSQRNKYRNTSYLITESGKLAAKYSKIHLFDTWLKGVESKESKTIRPGSSVVTAKVRGVRCGFSICYDLRFPELYRKLAIAGAKIIFVPANFTYVTGKAHWEILLRARAIENQAFVLAPGQTGAHPSTGIESYGNSMIVDPWGRVLARASAHEEGAVFADLDLEDQARLRRSFPVLKHQRLV